jgi:hypothetical protein
MEKNKLETSVEQILLEQKASENLFVLESLGEKYAGFVKITPWHLGVKCTCGSGYVVPRSALKRITKTGMRLRCGRSLLQVVEIEFSDAKLLTFAEHFLLIRSAEMALLQRSSVSGRSKKARGTVERKVTPYLDTTVSIEGDKDGGGGSVGDNGGGAGSGEAGGDGSDGSGGGGFGDNYGPPGSPQGDECFSDCFKLLMDQAAPGMDYAALSNFVRRAINTCNQQCFNPTF